ncbi:MAG: LPS-assembly protein LptD [Prevotellaceae bacterium]|jgi:lipopolysaccharide assembly outer membrane protein LptD (OstA)|nr:LPS-assembly protein LptD [Prevotellaceae bacterium]
MTKIIRYISLTFILLSGCLHGFASMPQTVSDTIIIQDTSSFVIDSVAIYADSIVVENAGEKKLIDDPVLKNADSAIVYDIANGKSYLYRNAEVTYQDKQIKADYIEFDANTKIIYAKGLVDTSGNVVGNPVFKDGEDVYEIKEVYYNFETKIAKIIHVITQHGEAYMHGDTIKKMPDNTVFSRGGKFTTCDEDHPHFYIKMRKSKMIPSKKPDTDGKGGKNGQVLFDFAYLVVEDVPLPLFLPFGFFPLMTDVSSGVIIPSYGEEAERGFYLQRFGYYFILLKDHIDATLTGDWYSKGSWGYQIASRYMKRYKYSGSFNYQSSTIKTGDKGSPDYSVSKSYSVSWSHQKAPQTNPTTTFQANVNFSSSTHKRYNEQTTNNDYLQNTASSSISFSKNWEGTPFSMTASFNHSQNMRDSTYSIGFPNFTFAMTTVYPFRSKAGTGKRKFYENINFGYNTNFSNSVSNVKEDDLFKDAFWDAMKHGMNHNFSISLPSFTLAKYINASPSIRYGQTWYFQSVKRQWDTSTSSVIADTTSSFGDFGVAHTYSGGISFNTRIYGLFDKFKPGSKIRAIRHVMTPDISFSYTPNQMVAANGWRKVQTDAGGKEEYYNIYNAPANTGSPSQSKASGSINFSLGNTLEIKVRSKSDTTENAEKKIKILESFNISTSYNLLADSMNLSEISFNGRSTIVTGLSFNFGFRLNPYDIDERGRRINRFYWAKHFGLGDFTSFNFSTDYRLSGGSGNSKSGSGSQSPGQSINGQNSQNNFQNTDSPDEDYNYTPYYIDFNVPWSLSFRFNYTFTKSYSYNSTAKTLNTVKRHSPTLDFNGDLSLTKNWKISFTSGYDLIAKQITATSLSLFRDLHCFEFSFSWSPFGMRKYWGFTIRAKSGMLSDAVKYEKHSSFYDNYSY